MRPQGRTLFYCCFFILLLCLLERARRAAVKRGERPSKKSATVHTDPDALIAMCDDTLEECAIAPYSTSHSPAATVAAVKWPPRISVTCV